MDDDELREEFIKQMTSSYGQVETALGTEGYKEFLKTREAERAFMDARGERERAIASIIRVTVLIGMLFAMPVIVWLWKWAI